MRDARSGSDLLLSLRFNGRGPDCILRRRVKELGLRRCTHGHRAGQHCVRSRHSYMLTSSAIGSVPVITGNQPLRVHVVGPNADPALVAPSSSASSRIPDGVDRRATDCLIRPDLQRHACHPTRQLMCATLTSTLLPTRLMWSVNAGVTTDWTFSALPRPGTRMLMMSLFGVLGLRACRCWNGLDLLDRVRETDDVFYQNHGGVAVVASSAVRLSRISAP